MESDGVPSECEHACVHLCVHSKVAPAQWPWPMFRGSVRDPLTGNARWREDSGQSRACPPAISEATRTAGGRGLRSHLRQRSADARSPSGKMTPTKGLVLASSAVCLGTSAAWAPPREPGGVARALRRGTTGIDYSAGHLGRIPRLPHRLGRGRAARWCRGASWRWIAGSFASSTLDPSDIDVSPIYDRDALVGLSGKPGSGRIKELFTHRARVVSTYKVEPFAVPWLPIPSTLLPDRLTPAERDVLSVRGGLDTWWGRVRPPGPRVAPVPPTTLADRGYVEVILR